MNKTALLVALIAFGLVVTLPGASAGQTQSDCSSQPYAAEIICRAKGAVCALTCSRHVQAEGAQFALLA